MKNNLEQDLSMRHRWMDELVCDFYTTDPLAINSICGCLLTANLGEQLTVTAYSYSLRCIVLSAATEHLAWVSYR